MLHNVKLKIILPEKEKADIEKKVRNLVQKARMH